MIVLRTKPIPMVILSRWVSPVERGIVRCVQDEIAQTRLLQDPQTFARQRIRHVEQYEGLFDGEIKDIVNRMSIDFDLKHFLLKTFPV